MAINTDINTMYDDELKRRLYEAKKARDQKSLNYTSQENDINNQIKQGNENYYTQKNTADALTSQELANARELNAAKGWLGGGSDLQAYMSANTNRGNRLGEIESDKRNYMNQRQLQLNDIAGQRTQLANSAIDEDNAIRAEIEAARKKDLIAEQQRQESLNLQRQQQAVSSSKTTATATKAQQKEQQNIYQQNLATVQNSLAKMDPRDAYSTLVENKNELIQNLGQDYYNQLLESFGRATTSRTPVAFGL
jgi:hypothetical protein